LQSEGETAVHLLDDWFDPIEAGLRDRVREFIQAMIESELETALARPRYGRRPRMGAENTDGPGGIAGYRHGHRSRYLNGGFHPISPILGLAVITISAERYEFDFSKRQGVRCGAAPIRGVGSSSRIRNTPPSVSILDPAHQRATNALASVASRK
jgi:hypothetical protein